MQEKQSVVINAAFHIRTVPFPQSVQFLLQMSERNTVSKHQDYPQKSCIPNDLIVHHQ
jgi:hypothetical protein